MTSPTQTPSRALGWLLALPALVGALITLIIPTVQTIVLSFETGRIAGPSRFVGLDNYGQLVGDAAFWRALGFSLSLSLAPLLVTVVVGPLLALALDRAGAWPRRAGRIVLSLAIVTFSPVAVAAAWLQGLRPDASGVVVLAEGLRDPATAPGALRLVIAAATFGVLCALAVTAFLPTLRGGTVTASVLAVGALLVLATLAVALQAFSVGLAMTQGGPNGSTDTVASLQYSLAFRDFKLGLGAAMATASGVLVGVLGVVATIVAAVSGLRITLTPRPAPDPGSRVAQPAYGQAAPPLVPGQAGAFEQAGSASSPAHGQVSAPADAPPAPQPSARRVSTGNVLVGVAALGVVAVVALLLAWPWLSALFAAKQPVTGAPSTLRTQVNTWVPAVIGALISVGTAYLAALGIGGLRPLGRHSEWLLLPFAPWLFAGFGPLSLADWQMLRGMGLVDTFLALIPPLLVSVPAMLVLTLLCKGLAERTDRDFLSGVVLRSLPMAGILAGAVALMNGQDLLWPLLAAQEHDLATAPVSLMQQLMGFRQASPDVGVATPLVVVVVALAATVAAQLLYLDRLAITAGNGSRSARAAA
ncbi:sugar ABC transporter permease [Nonomuraea sp. NPDC005983]|uniref:sugar ABC transporter permease n=1 Tax=Nonomuraea sp. NPDC005983 TaxID=3155595 RepID=UPI0033B89704